MSAHMEDGSYLDGESAALPKCLIVVPCGAHHEAGALALVHVSRAAVPCRGSSSSSTSRGSKYELIIHDAPDGRLELEMEVVTPGGRIKSRLFACYRTNNIVQ